MLNIITKGVTKLFGTKSDRDIKSVMPLVEQIKSEYDQLTGITDEALRGKSYELRDKIAEHLSDIDQEIASLKNEVKDNPKLDIQEKEDIFGKVDKLEEDRNKALEDVLETLLPLGFAVVRETARRLKENGKLEVKATFLDKELAATRPHIEIKDDTATWHNKWLAAGNEITWDMVHYEVQLIGGIVLHQGKISEMATGEGKTLVATLPAF